MLACDAAKVRAAKESRAVVPLESRDGTECVGEFGADVSALVGAGLVAGICVRACRYDVDGSTVLVTSPYLDRKVEVPADDDDDGGDKDKDEDEVEDLAPVPVCGGGRKDGPKRDKKVCEM